MQKKYLPHRPSILKGLIMLGLFIILYLLDNLPLTYFGDLQTYANEMKILLWISLTLFAVKLPKIRSVAKLRYKEGLTLWAFVLAFIFILISIGAGLFDGLGKSPYSHSLKGIISNIFQIGSVLVCRELIRGFTINSLTRRDNFFLITLLLLIFSVSNFPINIFTGLNDLESAVQFLAQYFAPEFSHNVLATYLAMLGGTTPSLVYMGTLQAFHWLSPILPNLSWLLSALIGILYPIFSIIALQNIYNQEAKLYKKRDNEKDGLFGWIVTSLFSIGLIWFVVGVFPVYPSVIATGSMEPMIKPGDVILVDKSFDKNALEIGNVIQFKRDNILISHRIIEIIEDENGKGYLTKGDNNSAADTRIVRLDQVRGKIVEVVPKVGWLTLLLKNRTAAPDDVEF